MAQVALMKGPSGLIVPGVERKALQQFSGKKEAAVVDAAAVDAVESW